jgi:hypothetical protein
MTHFPRAAQRLRHLHGPLNSAGIRDVGSILDRDPEAWHKILSVNINTSSTPTNAEIMPWHLRLIGVAKQR